MDETAEAVVVDIDDEDGLAAFCHGCCVVVNCAGPSHRILDRVARAALAAGADYVDPAGDDPLFDHLARLDVAVRGRRAVVSAGLLPGLSGLLPRLLAREGYDRAGRLTAFLLVRDRFSPAAAADYLLSLDGTWGERAAVWRGGARVARALEPLIHVELPFFRGRMYAYPYLTTEMERLARSLDVTEARSYNVFENDRILAVVARIQRAVARSGDLVGGATELARAFDLELFGREPEQQLVFQLEATAEGRPVVRTLVLRATDTYAVTGAVTALAVTSVLRGAVAAGTHFAASALDPAETMNHLRVCPAVATVELVTGTPADALVEEGAL